jgi:hypothetical protein
MERPKATLAFLFIVACSGEVAPGVSSSDAPSADRAVPPPGVADRGADPAVVAIDFGDRSVCSGALVAPDIVLTARRCVSFVASDTQCPAAGAQIVGPRAPSSLRVLVGDELATAEERARGRDLVVPIGDALCDADIALVILDTPIDDIRSLSVRATGAAKGDHLRTVAFATLGGTMQPQKLVSDHLPVLDTTAAELVVAEACGRGAGGPAIDESTGQIVGVASRSASSCVDAGSSNAYTRTDAFFSLFAQALGQSSFAATSVKGQKKIRTGPIDMGGSCGRADDCAAGICVLEPAQEYCSRACDPHDRCPTHFRCKKTVQSDWVCVR